jgi:hypothetical protein
MRLKLKALSVKEKPKKDFSPPPPPSEYKRDALIAMLKGKKKVNGGIVIPDGPNGWKIFKKDSYSYEGSLKNWDDFSESL